MDGPDEGGVQDEPAGNRQLKNAPDHTHKGDHVFGISPGAPPHTLFFFGHSFSDFQALILLLDFIFSHDGHLTYE
jgi:hypothetical protein